MSEKPAQTSVQKPRSLFVELICDFFSCVGTLKLKLMFAIYFTREQIFEQFPIK
jgi:hypothetical protein